MFEYNGDTLQYAGLIVSFFLFSYIFIQHKFSLIFTLSNAEQRMRFIVGSVVAAFFLGFFDAPIIYASAALFIGGTIYFLFLERRPWQAIVMATGYGLIFYFFGILLYSRELAESFH